MYKRQGELGLKGLKLHPSKQRMFPADDRMWKLYDICRKYRRPVVFHSGVSMEPGTLTRYAHPLEFEEVAYRYPDVKICLAHFGWPWVREVCMLMLKYRNVYTDTALLYFDDPRQFYHQSLEVDIGKHLSLIHISPVLQKMQQHFPACSAGGLHVKRGV